MEQSLQAPSTFFLMNLVISRHIVLSFPPQIAKEMRETLSLMEEQMEQKLANSLFPVYLSLQAIYKDKAFLQKRSEIITLSDLSYMAALHLSHRSKCTTLFLKQLLENLTISHINCFLIKNHKDFVNYIVLDTNYSNHCLLIVLTLHVWAQICTETGLYSCFLKWCWHFS